MAAPIIAGMAKKTLSSPQFWKGLGIVALAITLLSSISKIKYWFLNLVSPSNENIVGSANNLPMGDEFYLSLTSKIKHALGVDLSWYQGGWTEDEERVVNLLKGINKDEFAIVKKLYSNSTKDNRNLRDDLIELLSTSDISKLYHLGI